jgi:hypothetical protein
MGKEVRGIAKACDSNCPICVGARGSKPWLKSVVKAEYYIICKPVSTLGIPWPCAEREKQTGKKPWQ